MSTESVTPDSEKVAANGAGIDQAVENAQRALRDSLAAAERRLSEAAKTAERVIKDSIETIRSQT